MLFSKNIRTLGLILGLVMMTFLVIIGSPMVWNGADLVWGAPGDADGEPARDDGGHAHDDGGPARDERPQTAPQTLLDLNATAADVPSVINYQGYLRDAEGNPITGVHTITFRIYGDVSAPVGSELWLEEHTDVTVRDGQFSVLLGNNTPLAPADFNNADRFLGVQLDSFEEMVPRQRFAAVPYAFNTYGLVVNSAGNVGIGTSPDEKLTVPGTVHVVNAPGFDGVFVDNAAGDGVNVTSPGRAGVTVWNTGGDGVYVENAGTVGTHIRSPGDDGIRVVSPGRLGIGIWSTVDDGVYVQDAGEDGLYVQSPGGDGVDIRSPAGDGMYVSSAGDDGVSIASPTQDGVTVSSAGRNGVIIFGANNKGVEVQDTGSDGVGIYRAGNDGVYVAYGGDDGVSINTPGQDGVTVSSANRVGVIVFGANNNGMEVQDTGSAGVGIYRAGDDGVYVQDAGDDGIHTYNSADYGGVFGGNIYVSGSCNGCTAAIFGRNVGQTALEPGDVVSVHGVTQTDLYGPSVVVDVDRAAGSSAVVGVVAGWAELDKKVLHKSTVNDEREHESSSEEQSETEDTGQNKPETEADGEGEAEEILRLVPREGPAQPGEYVNIIIGGLAQVKTSAVAGAIKAGTRLTAADVAGHARAVQTVEVQGVQVAENTPVLGIALESLEAGDGLIWVLVNPR